MSSLLDEVTTVTTTISRDHDSCLTNQETLVRTRIPKKIVAKRRWCAGWQVVVRIGPRRHAVYRLFGAKSLTGELSDFWNQNQGEIRTIDDTVPFSARYSIIAVAFKDSNNDGPHIILPRHVHKILGIFHGTTLSWYTAAFMKSYLKADTVLNHTVINRAVASEFPAPVHFLPMFRPSPRLCSSRSASVTFC